MSSQSILWNFITGTLHVEIEGIALNRLLGAIGRDNLNFRNVWRVKYTNITGDIGFFSFHRLQRLCEEYHCEIRVLKALGIPIIIRSIGSRLTLSICMAAIIILMYVFSNSLLVYNITGLEDANQYQQVKSALYDAGLYRGKFLFGVSFYDNEQIIKEELPWISKISIGKKGTQLIVNILVKTPTPQIVDDGTPCHILADKDGVLNTLNVLSGTAVAEPGQIVHKGQLLASGRVLLSDGREYTCHANVQATAYLWHSQSQDFTLIEEERIYTGEEKSALRLVWGDRTIFVFTELSDMNDSEWEISDETISMLGEGFLFPIRIQKTLAKQYYTNVKLKDRDAVEEWGYDTVLSQVMENVPADAQILDTWAEYRLNDDNTLKVTAFVKTLEPIGITVPFE